MSDQARDDGHRRSAKVIPLRRQPHSGSDAAGEVARLARETSATLVELVAIADAHGLGISEHVRLAATFLSQADVDQPAPATHHSLAPIMLMPIRTSDGRIVLVPLDRRAFLRATGTAAALVPLQPFDSTLSTALSPVIGTPTGIGSETLGYLRQVFKHYVKGDALLGPRHFVPTIGAHLELIEQLLRHARGSTRTELLELGTRYAEFAGWISQDSGDLPTAAHWSNRALEWAHQANDHLMVAYVLMRKSNQASDERNAGDIIDLAEAAQRAARPMPRQIQALILRQRAHGHALEGEELACHRALDRGTRLAFLGQRDGDDGPGGYCSESYVEAHRATAWLELGQPHKAVTVFERVLAHWPERQRRDRGIFLARLAASHVSAGDPEPAASTATAAMDIWRTSGSARIAGELCRLRPRLRTWQHHPEVAPVYTALAQLGE